MLADPRWRNLGLAGLAVLALVAGTLGVVLGADQEDEPTPASESADAAPANGVSFLARIIPSTAGSAAAETDVPGEVRQRIERLSARQKAAQLLLVGYAGPDPGASVPPDLRRLGPGGIVITGPNYAGADALRDVAGGLRASAGRDRIPPFVMTIQEGGELNSFPDLPPAESPADLPSVREAARQSRLSARTLRSLGLTGVLGPVVDVGLESGSALGVRLYSDDPEEVARYAASAVRAYESQRMFSAVKHLPGLGAADRSPQDGPASVGLGLPELRERDLIPFRAAIDAGVPGVVLSNALYPFSDFTVPASLSPAVADELLRDELGFEGVAITDDLSDPSVTVLTTVPDAAVEAVRAGADMAFVSGPAADQAAAHAALLSAVRSGRISRARLDRALERILVAKRRYRVLR